MATITTYSVRFDGRSKELILLALSNLHQQIEQQIAQGGGTEQVLQTYDEVGQVRRGILLAPPEEVETGTLEQENSENPPTTADE